MRGKKDNMKRALLCGACLLLVLGCEVTDDGVGNTVYKDRMREFVQAISGYARGVDPDFIIIPQTGLELVTADADNAGPPHAAYLAAIDGVGQEDLFFGYDNDDQPTSTADTNYLTDFLDIAEANGVQALVTDYCSTLTYMNNSYSQNNAKGYISFAADHRELDDIPDFPIPIYGENGTSINTLADAQNFLYLIDPTVKYNSKGEFIDAVAATNYDVVLIDLFYDELTELTPADITQLKTKHNNGSRLVIAYMSIGEAENYRYYWDAAWVTSPPSWLKGENPDWPGNYKVEYWDPAWQAVIFGNDESYLHKIMAAGFDGVYLDIIDAFEYFE